jgi:hypothetical protein
MSLCAMMVCKVASLKADDMKVVSVMVANDRAVIAKIHMLAMDDRAVIARILHFSTEVNYVGPAFCPPWTFLRELIGQKFVHRCGLLMCDVCLHSYHHGVGDEAGGAA